MNLCCVINPFICCDSCKGKWCGPCWRDQDNAPNFESWGPDRFRGHKDIPGGGAFMCQGQIVDGPFEDSAGPIRLQIVKEPLPFYFNPDGN